MTLPDLLGCPRCDRSIRRDWQRCPGCGARLRVVRLEVAIFGKAIVHERVLAFHDATPDSVVDELAEAERIRVDEAAFRSQDPIQIEGDDES